jgi:hypothetical protein
MPLVQHWGWYEFAKIGEGSSFHCPDHPTAAYLKPSNKHLMLRPLDTAEYQQQVLKHVMPDMKSYPSGPATLANLRHWIGEEYRRAKASTEPVGQLLSQVRCDVMRLP